MQRRPAYGSGEARPIAQLLDAAAEPVRTRQVPDDNRPAHASEGADRVGRAGRSDRGRAPDRAAKPGVGLSLAARALQALARREHTRAELQRKLSAHAESAEQLDAVLATMQDKGFLSDERAAASLVRQKSRRYGSARIRQDLQAKGVARELAEAMLAPLHDDEWERALAVWQARFGHIPLDAMDWPERQRQRARQARFMTGRGFSPDIVRRLLDQRGEPDE